MRGRVHIWFIALFFAALVLPFPLFWLLRGGLDTSNHENRTLTSWPRPRGARRQPCLKRCWATMRLSATSL